MVQKIDLHIHSTFSDGQLPPEELIKRGQALGIGTMAITDHQTLFQTAEALHWGEIYGIRVIPGAEIKVGYKKQNFHLLMLGIDHENAALLGMLERSQNFDEGRLLEVAKRFASLGLAFSLEIAMKLADGLIKRSHIAQSVMAMPENSGWLEAENIVNVSDFTKGFMMPEKPAYVSQTQSKIRFEEAAELAHQAGGKVFFAHPGVTLRGKSFQDMKRLFDELYVRDLDGIEVYHPENYARVTKFLKEVSGEYGFLESAGSDFHGVSHFPHLKLGEWNNFGLKPDFSWLAKLKNY